MYKTVDMTYPNQHVADKGAMIAKFVFCPEIDALETKRNEEIKDIIGKGKSLQDKNQFEDNKSKLLNEYDNVTQKYQEQIQDVTLAAILNSKPAKLAEFFLIQNEELSTLVASPVADQEGCLQISAKKQNGEEIAFNDINSLISQDSNLILPEHDALKLLSNVESTRLLAMHNHPVQNKSNLPGYESGARFEARLYEITHPEVVAIIKGWKIPKL